jgi:dihydrofolate synthase / folylpolyglutamate synthase
MTSTQTPYQESLAWLYGLQRFGIKLGLENMRRLLRELEVMSNDAKRQIFATRVIHVAGTNGKGSVCAMVEAICRSQGLRTGLFTSPHLVTFRERIQINGELISEQQVADRLGEIRQLVANWDPHPTFFEVTTTLALKHFADKKIDVAILETGLGGRLDATNAVPSNVSVITPIDLDHQKWLGESIDKIAQEKAGIIKPHTPVISSSQHPDAEKVIRARANECDAPIDIVRQPYDRTPIALRGALQKQNAALAIAAIRSAGIEVGELAIARGLMSVSWPARFQFWDDRTIIDGAHNPAAAHALAGTWREIFGDRRATIILAVLSDKDVTCISEALAPITGHILLPPIRSERAMPPEEVAKTLSTIAPKLHHSIAASLGDALTSARAKSSPILITGSLHFAGEALAFLQGRPAAFEECSQ